MGRPSRVCDPDVLTPACAGRLSACACVSQRGGRDIQTVEVTCERVALRAVGRKGRWAERPRSVRRGQAVHLGQDPLFQALVLHVLGQGVEAVRVLDRVAADDLADTVLRLSGPVLAGEGGRR